MTKPPDYSKTAENLCNPVEVKELLLAQRARQQEIDFLNDQAQSFIPDDIKERIKTLQQELSVEAEGIRGYIDTFGSYQDVEAGLYGLKYRRISKSYQAEPFIENYPKYSPAVIINSVNVKALEGLIKGGLLTEEELKAKGITQESVSYAYVVK